MEVDQIVAGFSTDLEDEEILAVLKYGKGENANLLYPSSLCQMYKLAFVKYNKGKFISLTKKDQALLKQMIVQVLDQKTIGPAILAAVKNWKGFCKYVEKNTSAFNLPAMPDVMVLRKYVDQAIQYAAEKLTTNEFVV